jgi:RNA polymerase sigma factor (sigma-70 family)
MRDCEWLESIYNHYFSQLYALAFSILRTEKDAEDALHNAFVNAMVNAQKGREKDSPLAWLYVIVRNEALMLLRRRQRRLAMQKRYRCTEDPGGCAGQDPVEQAHIHQEHQRVRDILAEMNPKDRELVYLYYYKEMSLDNIARLWGEKASTVRVRHHRIKKMLAAQLERTQEPETNKS